MIGCLAVGIFSSLLIFSVPGQAQSPTQAGMVTVEGITVPDIGPTADRCADPCHELELQSQG
jgi:hypothetical protein